MSDAGSEPFRHDFVTGHRNTLSFMIDRRTAILTATCPKFVIAAYSEIVRIEIQKLAATQTQDELREKSCCFSRGPLGQSIPDHSPN
jgi:hypothetical protein